MKRCPKCNQEFAEEWLTFCTSDGTPLTEAPRSGDYPPPPTIAMSQPPVTATQEERPTIKMPSEGVYGGPLAPSQPAHPVAPVWQPPPPPLVRPPQAQQGLAITSLILGCVSITVGWCCYFGVLTSPIAIGLGIFSLVQIKNNPVQYTGKPLAIIGIATGSLYFVGLVLIIMLYGLAFLMQGVH
jgi:hypothetical protein